MRYNYIHKAPIIFIIQIMKNENLINSWLVKAHEQFPPSERSIFYVPMLLIRGKMPTVLSEESQGRRKLDVKGGIFF